MEPLKRQFCTGIHIGIEDKVAWRKPGGRAGRGCVCVCVGGGGEGRNKSKLWQKNELGGDALSTPRYSA
jgi:hypothetical protein